MTTKLELLLAAQKSAADSLHLTGTAAKPVDVEAHIKSEFSVLSIHKDNWPFFRDHYNGARLQYIHAVNQPIDGLPKPENQ